MLAYAKAFLALWPGARDDLEASGGAMLAPGHPCLPVWVASTAELSTTNSDAGGSIYLAYVHLYTHRNAL